MNSSSVKNCFNFNFKTSLYKISFILPLSIAEWRRRRGTRLLREERGEEIPAEQKVKKLLMWSMIQYAFDALINAIELWQPDLKVFRLLNWKSYTWQRGGEKGRKIEREGGKGKRTNALREWKWKLSHALSSISIIMLVLQQRKGWGIGCRVVWHLLCVCVRCGTTPFCSGNFRFNRAARE